jgi:hypothetical protein
MPFVAGFAAALLTGAALLVAVVLATALALAACVVPPELVALTEVAGADPVPLTDAALVATVPRSRSEDSRPLAVGPYDSSGGTAAGRGRPHCRSSPWDRGTREAVMVVTRQMDEPGPQRTWGPWSGRREGRR